MPQGVSTIDPVFGPDGALYVSTLFGATVIRVDPEPPGAAPARTGAQADPHEEAAGVHDVYGAAGAHAEHEFRECT